MIKFRTRCAIPCSMRAVQTVLIAGLALILVR